MTPHHLEYSEKDDCFRLIASGLRRSWVIRLSRVLDCSIVENSRALPPRPNKSETLVFELEDKRHALERVLLHFSHLEKETKRLDETHYRVTLQYDRADETEMVIRILSFGPVIRVLEPARFIGLLRERIERQRELAAFLPGEARKKDDILSDRKDVKNMIEIRGQYNTALCYCDELEDSARQQIQDMCDERLFAGSRIRIMPDVHAGTGCTIGTTMTVTDRAAPEPRRRGHRLRHGDGEARGEDD